MLTRKLICLIGKLIFIFKRRTPPKSIKRAIIIRSGALGDVLLTTPLIKVLADSGLEVDYCTSRWASIGLKNNPYINDILEVDDSIFFGKKDISLIKLGLFIRKEKYDAVFVLDKHWLAGIFGFLCGKFRIGFDRYGEGFANNLNVKFGDRIYEGDKYLQLAQKLGLKIPKDYKLDYFVQKKDETYAKKILKNKKDIICILPGGARNPGIRNDNFRRWPIDRYKDLIKKLSHNNFILILGGKDDISLTKDIKGKNILNLTGRTSIDQTAALIKHSNMIICNDSGTMHLAGALNDRVISIFGATDPIRKAPKGKNMISLWKKVDNDFAESYGIYDDKLKENIKNVIVDEVYSAVKKLL